jgi:septal ring factor EnvC (AmiA/AmiB activator)
MSDKPSAAILEFRRLAEAAVAKLPRVPPPAPPQDTPPVDESRERLVRALAALGRALAEQQSAVKEWRESLARLRGSVGGLAASLGGFQEKLGELKGDVDHINRQARALESWADGVIDAKAAKRAGDTTP